MIMGYKITIAIEHECGQFAHLYCRANDLADYHFTVYQILFESPVQSTLRLMVKELLAFFKN